MKIMLIGSFFCVFHTSSCATEKPKMDESIVKYFQKSDGLTTTSFPAFAFCLQELSFVLQNDSVFVNFCKGKSDYLAHLKNNSKDFYLTKLLQVKFLKDSLIAYCIANEDPVMKRLADSLNLLPEYKLQAQDIHLFFKSFTDESGVSAEKIETLLVTQDLNIIFNYIESNKNAKDRFIEWIDEDIEVWCPSVGSDCQILNGRITKYLYNRLSKYDSPLAQRAAKKMKGWFEF